jgi:transcription initiation factor IIE alpha subunit
MTVRKINAITLEEIIAIQFECRQCNARIDVPLAVQGRLPFECPVCGDTWVVNNRSDLHQRFFATVNQLNVVMRQLAEGTNNVNCILSIELKPEIKSTNDLP